MKWDCVDLPARRKNPGTGQRGPEIRRRPKGSACGEWQLAKDLRHSVVERTAGFLLTASATIGTTRARLQFGKRVHPIGRYAADVMVGDGIAQADIHGAYKNANANDCQQ